jgi:hypothetical protein
MNKQRRKLIDDALDKIEAAKVDLETARDEEQEFYDNMPESLQSGDKGHAAEEAAANLSEIIDGLETAIDAGRELTGE